MKNDENTFLIKLTFNFEYKYMTTKTFYSNSRLGDGRKPNVRTHTFCFSQIFGECSSVVIFTCVARVIVHDND